MSSCRILARLKEIEPERFGDRYDATEELFIVRAKDNTKWRVHKSVLAQSSVLARRCQTSLLEGNLGFPNVEPALLGLVMEYLYSGDYAPVLRYTYVSDNCCTVALAPQEGSSPDRQALVFARMYIMADELKLDCLMNLTVQKIKLIGVLSDETFYEMVETVYSCCQTQSTAFREYFLEHAPPRLRKLQDPQLTTLLKKIETGGTLASDFFLAQRKAFAKPEDNAAKTAISKAVAQLVKSTAEEESKKHKVRTPDRVKDKVTVSSSTKP